MNRNNRWEKLCLEVKRLGFENASPIARLVYSCEIGDIDQHAIPDLYSIMDSLSEKDARIDNLEIVLARALMHISETNHSFADELAEYSLIREKIYIQKRK